MKTNVRLVPMLTETSYAPLGAVGYCLTHSHFLDILWQGLALDLKAVAHTPADKLLDALVSVLAGCRAIFEINTRLRPDLVLAKAWGRRAFAEQSTVARTLDAFGAKQVQNLRRGSEALFRRESRCLQHDLAADWLWFDIDLTPLPISKLAEGSTKGKFAKKTSTAANWPAYMLRSITKRCSPSSTPVARKAARATYRRSRPSKAS